jgi:predicted histone-like DNA-binding protein
MAVKNPQFEINVRMNENSSSSAFGKYYPKAVEKQTISLRGLCKHMSEHNSIYGRDVIEGVLTKMAGCIIELVSQGNPVKVDGLGTFVPTVESSKNGISREDLIAGKWNASTYVKAIHIRFRPEGTGDDDITSRNFKDQCALSTYGVEEKIDLTPEESDKSKKVFVKKITPLADWIAEQSAASSNAGSGETTNP